MGKSKTKSACRSSNSKGLSSDDKRDDSKEMVSGSKGKARSTERKNKSDATKSIEEDRKERKKQLNSREEDGGKKEKDKSKEKKASEFEQHSIFEEVEGPAQPCQAQTHGVKNKMRWKIDVEPVDVNGDQKMPEIVETYKNIIKKKKGKKATKRETKKDLKDGEDDQIEEDIILCGRIMKIVKIGKIVEKELSEQEQETLRNYCRCGGDEDKATPLLEKLSIAILAHIVAKNEFCRSSNIPGELRMFAVEDSKAKTPMQALLQARKDLFYISWSKAAEMEADTSDKTWTRLATKKEKKS